MKMAVCTSMLTRVFPLWPRGERGIQAAMEVHSISPQKVNIR